MAFALLVLAIAPATYAGDWYVQAFVGVDFADDIEFDIDDGDVETSFDAGFLWGISFGYQFKHVRLDAEIDTSREADVDVHRLEGSKEDGSTGEVQAEAGIGNVLYDFRKGKRVSPYVGAGIGWAELELRGFSTDASDLVSGEDTMFAWQLLGGVGINVGEHWVIDFSLRYYETADGDFNTSTAAGDDEIQIDYSAFSATAGARYVF